MMRKIKLHARDDVEEKCTDQKEQKGPKISNDIPSAL